MDLEATRPADTEDLNDAEAAALPRVRDALGQLETVEGQLQEIAASLPEEAEEPEGKVSLRSVIECVLADSLQPAARDLRAALAGSL